MQTTNITAQQIVDRIMKNQGTPWRPPGVDRFITGNPEVQVKGVATTFMATFGLMQKAAKAGCNMIITHEPTFWSGSDSIDALKDDTLYIAKKKFIDENNIVVWRYHDNLHAHRPDFARVGLARVLGWSTYPTQGNTITVPPIELGELARDLQKKTGAKGMRVLGDPKAIVSKATLGLGYGSPRPLGEVDVNIVGEPSEVDGADNSGYLSDAKFFGAKKGAIILGHALTEGHGMLEVAEWVRTFVSEIPVEFIQSGEPFWSPE